MVRPTDFESLAREREFVPQAIFALPISYFAQRLQTAVSEGYDDLDHYEAVGLLVENFIPVAMMHHRGYPAGTTTMHLPFEVADPKLVSAIIGVVARSFDIPAEAVEWARSRSGPPPTPLPEDDPGDDPENDGGPLPPRFG